MPMPLLGALGAMAHAAKAAGPPPVPKAGGQGFYAPLLPRSRSPRLERNPIQGLPPPRPNAAGEWHMIWAEPGWRIFTVPPELDVTQAFVPAMPQPMASGSQIEQRPMATAQQGGPEPMAVDLPAGQHPFPPPHPGAEAMPEIPRTPPTESAASQPAPYTPWWEQGYTSGSGWGSGWGGGWSSTQSGGWRGGAGPTQVRCTGSCAYRGDGPCWGVSPAIWWAAGWKLTA